MFHDGRGHGLQGRLGGAAVDFNLSPVVKLKSGLGGPVASIELSDHGVALLALLLLVLFTPLGYRHAVAPSHHDTKY